MGRRSDMNAMAFDLQFSNLLRKFAKDALAKADELKIPMVLPEMKEARAKMEYIAATGRVPPEESE